MGPSAMIAAAPARCSESPSAGMGVVESTRSATRCGTVFAAGTSTGNSVSNPEVYPPEVVPNCGG